MIVLVRSVDNSCVPALESRLKRLIRDGLITAFLRDGVWVSTVPESLEHERVHRPRRKDRPVPLTTPL